MRSLARQAVVLPLVTGIIVTAISLLAIQTDDGNLFPLLVIPVIAWAVAYGTFAGVASALVVSIYSVTFSYFVLDHVHTVPYVLIAAFAFVAVGYIVGALSDLRRTLALQQSRLAETSARLEAELEEKQTLLVEVHHRLKNNMNTVLQLLTLQADASDSPETSAALRDAGNRMRSMVVLYDKLHQSESIQRASARDYLQSLVGEVAGSLSTGSRVAIVTDIDEFDLDAKTLSTVGIIVNELLTNAMKHAFPESRRGTITVSAGIDDGVVTITVADDGVGVPEPRPDAGFGSTLVGALAGQLDARLSVQHLNGTRFTLTFMPGED